GKRVGARVTPPGPGLDRCTQFMYVCTLTSGDGVVARSPCQTTFDRPSYPSTCSGSALYCVARYTSLEEVCPIRLIRLSRQSRQRRSQQRRRSGQRSEERRVG